MSDGGYAAGRSVALGLDHPVVDVAVLSRLAEELEGDEVVWRIVGRYREALPARVHRLVTAIDAEDFDEAMDAVLSLKVTSATVGAALVSGLAARVELGLATREWPFAAGVMSVAAGLVPTTDQALGEVLTTRA